MLQGGLRAYTVIRGIGAGTNGECFLAEDDATGSQYVLKLPRGYHDGAYTQSPDFTGLESELLWCARAPYTASTRSRARASNR